MIRDCAQFDTWLDGERDPSLMASAHAHAAGCERCAGALELEARLGAPPIARADASFTEGVLARVRGVERSRAASRLVLADLPTAWWLRAPAEPSAALALAAAALLAWRGDGLWSLALALSSRAQAHDWMHGPGSGVLDAIGGAFSGVASGTLASGAVLAVLLPMVGLASWLLYGAVARLVANAVARPTGSWLPELPRLSISGFAAHE